MSLALNNNRGSVYSGRMKIEVPERSCLNAGNRYPSSTFYLLNKRNYIIDQK